MSGRVEWGGVGYGVEEEVMGGSVVEGIGDNN